ncbi:MAG TPA: hypothetical protein VND22_07100 [Actinomycetota bacterium]|nr:hypothetical protein [Actinomycetota bacterium]
MRLRTAGIWFVLIWAAVPLAFLVKNLAQYGGTEGTRDALIVSATQRFALRIPMILLAIAYLRSPARLRNSYWLLPVSLVFDAVSRLFETSSWFLNQRAGSDSFEGIWILLNMFFWVGLPILGAVGLWIVRPRPLIANAFYSEGASDESGPKIPLRPREEEPAD